MKLEKFFTDLFDALSFSRSEIDTFATDHLPKLKNNNPNNIYNSIITATETKLAAYKATMVDASDSLSVQMGSTDTKNKAKTDLLAFISRKEGVLKDIFYNNKPGYIEFYPRGVMEYNDAGLEELAKLAARYKTATNKYVAELGAAFKTESVALADAYINSRGAQVGKKATNNDGNITLNDERKALTKQLTINVHTIAANNIDNATAVNTYFNEGLLYNDITTKAVVMPTT